MTFTYPNNKSPENAEDFSLMDLRYLFSKFTLKEGKKCFVIFLFLKTKNETNQFPIYWLLKFILSLSIDAILYLNKFLIIRRAKKMAFKAQHSAAAYSGLVRMFEIVKFELWIGKPFNLENWFEKNCINRSLANDCCRSGV